MPIDGVVRQTAGGSVMQCSNAQRCYIENGLTTKGQDRTCILSIDHGDRCQAWDSDGYKWLIDVDITKIKQLP